jgi:hypothetical protein
MVNENRLVLIGNGFDLAHGLRTTYKDFLDWYMSEAFKKFIEHGNYQDDLIEIKWKHSARFSPIDNYPKTVEETLDFINGYNQYLDIIYKSRFYKELLGPFSKGNWVSIECFYFQKLKGIFNLSSLTMDVKREQVRVLNQQFNYLIKKLSEYFVHINDGISDYKRLSINNSRLKISDAFKLANISPVTFLNFNYTETLFRLEYADENEIIHIHGKASDPQGNPIIFGYGDETDSTYQHIEDSGKNIFLEHIKSFGYFKTNNYQRLISIIDSAPYTTYIVGHSCGLSDRILLNEIFEHQNCKRIEIFYHKRKDGSDNFTEITQEISRHFRPQNKSLMRRRISVKDSKNIIPQNNSL